MLYEAGPRAKFFSSKAFVLSLIKGTYHAAVLFFVYYFTVGDGYQV